MDAKTLELIRAFVQEELIPLEAQFLQQGASAVEAALQEKRCQVKTLGLFAPHMPKEYGGLGLSLTEFAHVSEELGRTSLGHYEFVYGPCIWKKGDFYYSTSGGTLPHSPSGRRTRAQFLYRSPDLTTWEYLHSFVEGDIFGLAGDDGGCPYFWPIGDRHILLHFSHKSGVHYLLGDYDASRDKFVVTNGGSFTFGSWYPGGVHAPTATPDGQGGVIALFNINVGKPTTGWDQIMSLPRRLTLVGNDDLAQTPAGDIESLRREHHCVEAQVLPANREVLLHDVRGKAIEIAAEIDLGAAQMVELNVLRSPG